MTLTRIRRRIRWMYLTLFPPKQPCPRCGSKLTVWRCGLRGNVTYRCFACFIKWDRHGQRYPWKPK